MTTVRETIAESALRAMAEGTSQESFNCNNVAREALAIITALRAALTQANERADRMESASTNAPFEACAVARAEGEARGLERAAKACEGEATAGHPNDCDCVYCVAAHSFAEIIRALQRPTPEVGT